MLGKLLKGGEVIELRSDLGGGKTIFVRGLARGVGSRARVTSPTFTLSRVYKSKKFDIHHYDFYRLNDPGIMTAQLAESVSDDKNIVIVEWADIVAKVLPPRRISIEFKAVNNNQDERQIKVFYTEKSAELIKQLEVNWLESRP